MGYAILWLAHLSFAIFFTTAACARASHLKKQFTRRFWPILIALLCFLSVASYAIVGAILMQKNMQPRWLFPFGVSLSVVFFIGVIFVLKSGLHGSGSNNQTASSWSCWRLTASCAAAFCIYFIAAHMIETRIIIQTSNTQLEASVNLIRLLPSGLPDELNAETYYHQAAQMFQPDKEINKWFLESDQADFDVTADRVTSVLTQYQKAMKITRMATRQNRYTLNPGMYGFYSWPIPNYSDYRNLARLFSLSARQKGLKKDLQGALADLNVIEKMARHMRQYPMLISFLVGRALDTNRIASLESILAYTNEGLPANFSLPTVKQSFFSNYVKALQVEGYGQLQGFSLIAATTNSIQAELYGSAPMPPLHRLGTLFWRIFLLNSDLKSAKKITRLMTEKTHTFEEMDARFEKINEAFEAGEFGIFTAIATPGFHKYGIRARQYDAQHNLATLALAVTVYQYKTGQYPASLDVLVPDYLDQIPVDPFDPKNLLKLAVIDGGLDLFSKGPSKESGVQDTGPIHFYLGKQAYERLRLKPAREETIRKSKKKKSKK